MALLGSRVAYFISLAKTETEHQLAGVVAILT